MTRLPRKPTRPTVTPPQRFVVHPLSLAALLALAGPAHALPQGGTVVGGQATIQTPSSTLQVVTQGSSKAIIDWRSFSIGAGEKVRFDQPSSTAVLLNRVTGYDPTNIFGQMQANGRIFLLNPQGVLFGAGARIDVGGMVASTLSLSNADFLASRYNLSSTPGVTLGEVRNEGTISAPGGTVVLAGPTVANTGSIEADRGRVGLAATGSVLVDVEGDGLIFFNTQATDAAGRLQQLGRIRADGGSVELRAAARASMADTVLNMDGVVQARSLGERNGRIVIDGGAAGITAVSGQLDASGSGAGQRGGEVVATGTYVLLDGSARIDAGGDAGAGRIRVGGGFQGRDAGVRNAQGVIVAPGAMLAADAGRSGPGGEVVVWADGTTRHLGAISARGGSAAGDGGQVEVSGLEALDFRGTVDLSAPSGTAGSLLLDPNSIEIKTGGAQTLPVGNVVDFSATPATTTIDPTNIASVNGLVTLQARNTITVTDQLVMTGANSALKAQAGGNITVSASIDTQKGIELSANDPGGTQANGRVAVGATLAVSGDGGSLKINNNGSANPNTLGASIVATGAGTTVEFIGATTLLTNASVSTGASTSFSGAVTGAQTLTVTTAGTVSFGSTVDVTSLAINNGGTTTLAGNVTTTGTQSYSGTVTLAAPVAFGASGIAFNGLDGGTRAMDVVADTFTVAGSSGNLGAITVAPRADATTIGLGSGAGTLALTQDTLDRLAGSSLTIGRSTGTAAIIGGAGLALRAPTTLQSATGTVSLTGVVGNGNTLAVNSAGLTTLAGATGLIALTSTGGGNTTLSGTITSVASQNYNEPVTLAGATTLNGGSVTLGNVTGGGSTLAIDTPSGATLGTATGLASLTVTGAGGTTLNGNVTTTAGQSYAGTTTLGGNRTLTGTSVSLGNVTGGGNDLTIAASTSAALGTVSGVADLLASGAGPTTLNGDVTTTATQTFGGVVLSGNRTLSGTALDIGGTVTGTGVLTLTASGSTTLDAVNGITGVVANGAGPTTLNANVTTTGLQSFGAVTLGGDVTLGASALTLGTVTAGANDLTVNAASTTLNGNVSGTGNQDYSGGVVLTGNRTLSGATLDIGGTVSGTGTLTLTASTGATLNAVSNITGVTANGAGATSLNGNVSTSGAQSYGAVTLGASTALTASGVTLGTVTAGANNFSVSAANTNLNGNVTGTGTQSYGAVTLGTNVTLSGSTIGVGAVTGGANNFTVTPTTSATLGAVTAANLTVNGPTATLGGNVTTLNGIQTYNANTSLSGPATLTAQNIDFNGAFNAGANSLALQADAFGFVGALTGTGAFRLSPQLAADSISVNGAPATANYAQGVVNFFAAGGFSSFTIGRPDGTGAIDVGSGGAFSLPTSFTVQALNAPITLGGTITGNARSLTTSTTGLTTVGGTLNGLSSFTVSGPAALGGSITTTGTQTYSGAVTLTGNTSLTGTTIGLGGVTGAGNDLSLAASSGITLANINGVNNLASTGAGTTTLGGSITTTGTQTYGNVATSGTRTLTGTTIAVNGDVSGSGTLTLTAGTGASLNDVNGIGSLVANGAGPTTLNGIVQTTGSQNYGAVTLGGDTTLVASGVTLGTVTAGANDLVVSSTNTTLNGSVTGTGTQNYGGLTLGTDVTLTGSTLTVGAAVSGGANDFTVAPITSASLRAVTAANFTATGTGTTTLGGDVTTPGGAQNYAATTLSVPVTLTAQGITLNGAFNAGANDLAMQTLGLSVGGGALSGSGNFRLAAPTASAATLLSSLTPPAAGDLSIDAGTVNAFLGFGFSSFTLGRPDATGAISVATGAGFSMASDFTVLGGTSPVTLGNIFGNGHALTVSTGGNTAVVNGISGLSTFDVTGTASLASIVGSSGRQTYAGNVTVAAGSTLSGSQLNFNGGTSIALGLNSLTLNTRDLNIAGNVTGGGSATLAAPTTNETVSFAAAVPSSAAFEAADIAKFGTVGSLTLGRSDGTGAVSVGALTLPANTTVAGFTAPVSFQGALAGANHSLTVATLGATTFAASPTGLSALTVGGPVTLPGGTLSTTGNQSYGNNLTITGNQTLDAQNITFTNTLALGANNLTLQYDGALTGAFTATGTGFVSLAPRTAGSTIGVGGLAGTFQVPQAALNSLAALPNVGVGRADGTGTINVGAVTLPSNLRVQSGSGDILFFGGATGGGLGHSLTIDTGGFALLNGAFSNLTSMAVSGSTRLIGATTVNTVGGGNVTFGGTLDSNIADTQSLAVSSSGATVFGGAVGGGGRGLLSLTTDAGGTTTLRGNVNALGVSLGDTVTLDAPAVTVTGSNVSFGGTLDSAVAGTSALTVNASGITTFGAAVGATGTLASLTTDAAGTTRVAAGAGTTGAQAFNDAVTLTGPGTFTGSTVAFGSTVDGAQALTVNAAGLTRFGGNVGATTALLSVTTDAPGTTSLTGTVRTTGAQDFGDAVTLAGATTATGTDIRFGGSVDGAQALAVNASGAGVFAGTVGAATPLASLTTSAAGSTSLAGNVTTTGTQTYGDAVTLTGPVTATGSAVQFNSTVNGAQALGVVTAGTTGFAGVVGGLAPLASLSTDAGGTTQLGGDVSTTGAQTYGDAVLLLGNAALSGASVAFAGTVDGSRALTVNAAGATTFGDAVGAGTPLTNLTTDAGGTTTLPGNVTTTGTQVYGDNVALAATTTLNASGIAFGANLAAGAFDLTTRSDALTLAGSASGSGALDIAPTTAAGTIGLAGAPGTLQLDATLLGGLGSFSGLTLGRADGTGAITAGAFALSTPTTIVGTTAPVTFIGDVTGNNQPLSVTSGGTTLVGAALTGLASFTVPNAVRFDAGTVATNLAQAYGSSVTLDGNATLSATTVQFSGAIDGPGALAVTAPAGTVFAAPVGAGTALASVTVDGPAAVNGGVVRSTGTQAWNGPLTLGADTTLTGTDIGFGAAVDGAQALTVAASGTATFAAPVGATTALTSLATSNAARLAGNVTTTGAQVFGGAVTLTGDTTLAGSSVSFVGGVDGAQALTSNVAGTTTFVGAVGGIAPLTSLTVANAAQVNGGQLNTTGAQTFGGAVALGADTTASGSTLSFGSTVDGPGALTATAAGTLTLGAAVGGTAPLAALTASAPGGISLGGNVTTSGAQSFTGPVTLAGDVVASGSSIAIAGTLDGAQALQLNASGATTLSGPVGAATALASLATDAAGTTSLGGNVTTTGAQSYLDATTLTGDATLAGGAVSFGSTLDGARTLVVNAADTRFGGAVGATTALASLATDAAGTTRLGGNVTTTGAQAFGDAVQLDAAATLTAASLAFGGTLDGAQALTAAVAGNTAFNGTVGAASPLGSLAVTGTTTMNAGSVTTTGSQTYAGAVTLARDTSLTANGLTFGAALDGAQALTIQNAGATAFGAAVGAATPLASLALGGGGAASLAGASVDTTGAQSYSGGLQLAGNTRLTGSSLAFGGSVAGAQDLQLQTDALTTAGGVSGSGVLSVTPLTASTAIGIAGGAGPIQVSQDLVASAGGFTQHVIGRADGTGAIDAGALTLSANTTLQSATGNISLNGATNGGFDLALNSGGTTRIAGPVGTTTALRSLATDAPGSTLIDLADASGSAQLVTTGAQTYADPVSATVPVRFVASAVTATQAANRFAGAVSGDVGSLALVDSGDVLLGDLALSAGGSIQAEGTITVGGALALNGGTLALTSNATPTAGALTDPDLAGSALLFRNSTLQEASATIFQTAGSAITSAPGSLLVLRTPKNGSLLFDEASNKLLGDVSAVAGTLNDNDTARFGGGPFTTVSVLRLNSSEIHVTGAPPADGNQALQRAGFEADAIKLTADVLTTGTDGQIRARLPFDNLQGSQTSLPGLTLVMSPQALAVGGGFGAADPASWIQVKVGSAQGGYLTVRPKGQSGETAIILLAGAEPKPFYDGAGKLTEVRVFYNGDTPRTPQESGALNAVIALVEEARHARFEEAVRTENVSSRLRSGVIAEVGSGRPATVGRESIRMPEVCDVPPGKFKCE